MKGILGRKVGMTEVFLTDGKLVPVTVIEVSPNVITQIKTVEKDGYNAIQIGAFDKREKVSNRPEMGHVKKANTAPKRFLREIRGLDVSGYTLGQVINLDVFEVGEAVDVTGTSKGKGFQGNIKRWGQSRGPETHGSTYHRRPGSMGTMRPMRVLKGKKLPGHMGSEQVTIQNLIIVGIDTENNCILVSGNVPGPKKSLVFIKDSIKGTAKTNGIELLSYEEIAEEPVVEEVVNDATAEVVTETAEEVTTEETVEEIATEENTEETPVTEESTSEEVQE